MSTTIDIPSETQALAVIDDKPSSLMRKATDVAGICREIVLKTACQIQGRKYVKCEGWMAIATAHGCVAGSRDVEKIEGGWRAIGEIRRIADGVLLAQAEGFVGLDETKTWAIRPEYACRAMAQTRAISRACRAAFAHVVVMMDANLSTTPAEEVPEGGFDDSKTPQERPQANPPAPAPKTPPSAPRSAARPIPASREERIRGLASWLGDAGKVSWAVAFLRNFTVDGSDANSALMPNEGLDGLNDSALDKIKADPKAFLARLDEFIRDNANHDLAPVAGGQTQGVAPAGSAPQPPQPATSEPWRDFPMPFGKKAGVPLAKLEKNYLYGLWANYKVETEYNGRAKKPETIAKERTLRQYLDDAGEHYQFTVKNEGEGENTP